MQDLELAGETSLEADPEHTSICLWLLIPRHMKDHSVHCRGGHRGSGRCPGEELLLQDPDSKVFQLISVPRA